MSMYDEHFDYRADTSHINSTPVNLTPDMAPL